jgi:hypothetical protein
MERRTHGPPQLSGKAYLSRCCCSSLSFSWWASACDNLTAKLASGQALLASGTFTVSYSNNPNLKPGDTITGNWMRVLVKEGSDWKIAAQSLTRQAPSATVGSNSTNK